MTTTRKQNIITYITDLIKALRCTPVCGREERAEYRRKKELHKKAFTIAIVVMIITILTGSMLIVFAKTTTPDTTACTVIEVESGDTLWSIAKENCPDSDPRDVIQEIKELNDMDTATIYTGMTLFIPVD